MDVTTRDIGGPDIDGLVARYAPIGRRRRRARQVRRAAGLTAIAVVAPLLFLVRPDLPSVGDRPSRPGAQADPLAPRLQEIERRQGELMRLAAALEEERRRLEGERDEIRTRMAALQAGQQTLSDQRQELEDLRAELARGEQAGTDRLAAQVAELERQREALEEQRSRFAAQRQLVARELGSLQNQRAELQRQQQVLETQRREFQALMDQFGRMSSAGPEPAPVTDPPPPASAEAAAPVPPASLPAVPAPVSGSAATEEEPEIPAPAQLLAASAVGDDTLGAMRGGVLMPGGYDITFGLTRTASINGVEQFSSTVTADTLAQLAGAGVGNGMLVQNGPGNVISADALAALAAGSTVIQNTLDMQAIQTRTILDVTLGGAAAITSDIAARDAIGQTLILQP